MDGPEATVHYRTGCLTLLVLLAFPVVVLFAIAAVRPALVEQLAEGRRAAWLAYTNDLAVAGVNIPIALFAGYMFYEGWRTVLRLRDPRMLVSDGERIYFHPTERRKPIAWKDVTKVRHHHSHMRSDLYFTLAAGRSIRLRNCDEYDADKLLESAAARLSQR